MGQTRIFKNNGDLMIPDGQAKLNYIDPGIVLLYADTEKSLVCSYFEGQLGQPIQATVEHLFDDEINMEAFPSVLALNSDAGDITLSDAPADDHSSLRWAFDGLTEDPLVIAEEEIQVIRRLVDPEFETASPSTGFFGNDSSAVGSQKLDFGVPNPRIGAQAFRCLVNELADKNVDIAVSKSGRVDEIEDTDIVIHVDEEFADTSARHSRFGSHSGTGRPGANQQGQMVAAPETKALLDAEKERRSQYQLRQTLQEPLKNLYGTYRDVQDREKATALRKEFNDQFRGSDLQVVDIMRDLKRKLLYVSLSLLVGFGLGSSLAPQTEEFVTSLVVESRSISSMISMPIESPLYIGLAVASVIVTVLAWRARQMSSSRTDVKPSTARSDFVRLSANAVLVIAIAVLVGSLVMIGM